MLAALTLLVAAAAPFEGVVHATLTGRGSTGVLTTYLSAAGVRAEGEITFGTKSMKTVVLIRADAPQVANVLDAQTQAWRTQPVGGDPKAAPKPLKAELVGREKVAGVECQHVKLTDGAGLELEYWMGHLPGAAALEPLIATASQLAPAVQQALASVGATGYPMRMLVRRAGTVELSVVVDKVETKALPKELFQPK